MSHHFCQCATSQPIDNEIAHTPGGQAKRFSLPITLQKCLGQKAGPDSLKRHLLRAEYAKSGGCQVEFKYVPAAAKDIFPECTNFLQRESYKIISWHANGFFSCFCHGIFLGCQHRAADKSKTNGFPVLSCATLHLANNENYFSYLIAPTAGYGNMWPNTRAKVQAKCHIKLHQSQRNEKKFPQLAIEICLPTQTRTWGGTPEKLVEIRRGKQVMETPERKCLLFA